MPKKKKKWLQEFCNDKSSIIRYVSSGLWYSQFETDLLEKSQDTLRPSLISLLLFE